MNTKQVIVLRKDLKMRKGKMIAQGAHASMKILLDIGDTIQKGSELPMLQIPMLPEFEDWITGLFTKICVSVDSEEELLEIYNLAVNQKLPCSIIEDAGLTEFNGVKTLTAVAIGPAKSEDIDKITGHLKLL